MKEISGYVTFTALKMSCKLHHQYIHTHLHKLDSLLICKRESKREKERKKLRNRFSKFRKNGILFNSL